MEIDIFIDSLTNCLVCTKSGVKYHTEYRLVSSKITKKRAIELKKKGWKFDWSIPQENGHNGKYKGVGAHLFAIACKLSWDVGNEGYVQFTAKSDLVEHYQRTLNAQCIDWHTLYIDSSGALKLINKYFKEGDAYDSG